MAPTLYLMYESPPVRAVLMTAKAIGLTLNEEVVNLFAGESLKPEYLKINPEHSVPTLVDDDGFALSDSHAIMVYLVSKYAKNDTVYPKDLKKQAIVNQRLHFDTGVANAALKTLGRPIYLEGKTSMDQKDKDKANEVYGFVETFLSGSQWIAGDSVTIADYSIITDVTGLNCMVPIDEEKFPKVIGWIKKCEELPEYEVNVKGLKMYEHLIKSRLK